MNPETPRLSSNFVTPPSVVNRIIALPKLPFTDLKALWLELFGSAPTTHSRPFLVRRIAYQLQENEFRKVNPELLERNKARIEALIEQERIKNDHAKNPHSYVLTPGTVLTREYQRLEHCVVVTEDNHFEYRGRRYKSLSVIAREITGTRWSGPLFFGLKTTIQPASKTKKKAKKETKTKSQSAPKAIHSEPLQKRYPAHTSVRASLNTQVNTQTIAEDGSHE
ncbi:MAG TPA: DUF2924 domain-containing protein [Cellvibrionaceae bacterium]|nr:DUF2924 domain-containing protein [Cellvibrionaceae bacterium]HMY37916.1 DUF2924 domain-containing protein [Marinagarivorans sp.]